MKNRCQLTCPMHGRNGMERNGKLVPDNWTGYNRIKEVPVHIYRVEPISGTLIYYLIVLIAKEPELYRYCTKIIKKIMNYRLYTRPTSSRGELVTTDCLTTDCFEFYVGLVTWINFLRDKLKSCTCLYVIIISFYVHQ